MTVSIRIELPYDVYRTVVGFATREGIEPAEAITLMVTKSGLRRVYGHEVLREQIRDLNAAGVTDCEISRRLRFSQPHITKLRNAMMLPVVPRRSGVTA